MKSPDTLDPPPPDEARLEATNPEPAHASESNRVGTITYTKAGLLAVFFYLLWGDFCFSLMETVMPSLLPPRLAQLGAPNWTVGLIMTTIPNLMTLIVNPIVSFRSDRFRSRWGRRIPFLAVASPFVALFLVLLGFSEPISHTLHQVALGGRFSQMTVLLAVICVLMILFQMFNAVIQSIYYYLFNDVIPSALLARVMSLFRIVGSTAGVFYSWFIFPFSENHLMQIFLGGGLLYLLGFGLMCARVKEGDYPPPPPSLGHQRGILAAIETYVAECFTHRFYWFIFLANAFWAMTWASGAFGLAGALQYMGFDRTYLGHLGAATGVTAIILLLPGGYLADRFHPLRIMLLGIFCGWCMGPLWIAFFFFRHSFSLHTAEMINIVLSLVSLPIGMLASAGEIALFMRILPRDRYGQFCSANALIRSSALIFGGIACGVMLDLAKRLSADPNDCYRFLPVWNWVFGTGYVFFYYLVFREWRRLGGASGFVPPNATPPRFITRLFHRGSKATE
jgi:MFS family permease